MHSYSLEKNQNGAIINSRLVAFDFQLRLFELSCSSMQNTREFVKNPIFIPLHIDAIRSIPQSDSIAFHN